MVLRLLYLSPTILVFCISVLHSQNLPKWIVKATIAESSEKFEDMATFALRQIAQDSITSSTCAIHHYKGYQLLGRAYEGQQQLANAQTAFRNSVLAARNIPDISNTYLAEALVEQADFFLRNAYYSQAEEIARHAFGTIDTLQIRAFPIMAKILTKGGIILWKSGSLGESENWLRRALLILQDTLDASPNEIHTSAIWLACIQVSRGKYQQADSLFNQYLPLLVKHSNLNASVTREAHFYQAKLWYETGRHQKALIKLTDMMSYLKIKEPLYVEASKIILDIHIRNARFKEALVLAEKVYHQYEDRSSEYPELYIHAYAHLLNTYHITGDSASAEKYFERASMITRKTYGASHTMYAWILGEKGLLLLQIGRFKDAITHLNKSASIYSEKSGNDALPFGIALQRLGYANAYIGRHAKAQPYLLKALDIYQQHLDPDHPAYCALMGQIAEMYVQVARYDEAEKYMKPFIVHTIDRMKGAEDQHPEVTDAYIQQAKLMRMMERFDEAQTAIQAAQKSALKLTGYDLYFNAEVYREDGEIAKALGKSKFALAQFEIAENILMNMPFKGKLPNRFMKRNQVALGIIKTRKAQTYIEIGKYYSTQKYLTEALDIFKAYQGEDFIPYAEALSAMAELSFHLGNYTEGERQSIRAKEIMAYVAGEFHPVYAKSLTTHAEILLVLGRTEEAKTLLEQALEISRTRLGENNSLYIQQLSNLGYLDFQQGDLKNASIRLKEAVKLSENAEIKNKQIPALNLIRLAMVQSEQKMYRAAEKNLAATFEILNTFSIPNQKLLSQAWFAYGVLCQDQMKWEESISHFKNAHDLFLQIRIESHPDVFSSKLHLAIAYWKTGKIDEAHLVFRGSIEQIQAYIHRSFRGLSDQEKNKIWNRLQPYFNVYAQFATEYSKQIPETVQQLFADQIKTKSFLLSGAVLMKSRIMNAEDESAKKLFEKWADLNGQLAFLSRIEKNEIIAHGYNLDEITTEIELTEKQLSQKSNWFQFIKPSDVYSTAAFSQLLAPQEAAIEIIKLNAIPNLQLPERYVAIILRNAHSPELVIIGDGQELEHKYLTNYRRSIQEGMQDPYSYLAYWNALAPFLQNIQKVYFSADGVFHLINPETFTNPQGQYLADVHQIIRVSNLQEVLAKDPLTNARKSNTTTKSAVILGNPDMYLDMNTLSRTSSLDAYPDLPGTAEEVDKLHRLFLDHKWKSTLFTGAAATEKALQSVKGPSVLHIATHGYFIESQSLAAGKHFLGMDAGFLTQHPMLRSGLLLSGSGSLLQGLRTHQKDNEDGLLSALEVMSMDLDQTELVVLSACESGLGTIVQGEGVLGLIRGFRIAGAQSVLMTLWKISDESTGNLMNLFYLHLLSGKSRNDALKAALTEFRTRYPNPQDWGAFVINGI